MSDTVNPFQPADAVQRARLGVATFEAGRSYQKVRAVVRKVETPTFRNGARAGQAYLSLVLSDRTGETDAKCWDGAARAAELAPGTVVEIEQIQVDEYNGRLGIKFEPMALRVLAAGEYQPFEFVASLPQEVIEQNWVRLHEFLDSIDNPHLQRLRHALFEEPEVRDRYKTHPSAVHHHHNYLGGNVEHVVGIMRVVDAIATSYPDLDRDLLVFGAFVHDLGKLREYAVDTLITVTDEGRLRGHLVMGAEWLGQVCARLRRDGYGFPRGLEDHLVHMILSHHRKGEWGSPKPPATPEAMVLHLGDYADSQSRGFLQDVEANRDAPDGWARRWDSDAGAKLWIKTRPEWD